LLVGGVHVTVMAFNPVVPTTPVGAPGALKVETALDADEATPVPALLTAATVKV
jgi:hypothetical protein